MKRPPSESISVNSKKVKTESSNKSSPREPKSILKKPSNDNSPGINIRSKKANVGIKKPILKTIKGKPKKSIVKSQEPDEQTEIETEVKNEEVPKISNKKPFKKNKNDHKDKFKQNTLASKNSKPADKKEERKKQKELRLQRREKERSYVLPEKAKKIFEEMRCSKCPDERKKELANELFDVLTGKFVNSARSHELSRMTQWIIKTGRPEIRNKVVEEVIGETVTLSKIKYANHIVKCLLNDCDNAVRQKLVNQFLGNIGQLLKNKFSVSIIEEYYSKYANSTEKVFMKQELYSELFRGGRNKSYTNLSEVLHQNPTLKSAILASTKKTLLKLVDKPFALSTNLVTDVLYDYLQNSEEQDKVDFIEILKTNWNQLCKTKSGNQIMMMLLWKLTPKVKKHIVKDLKTEVLNLAKSSGNVFLRSLFDSVDDTVLIKKAILPTILDNAEELVKDSNGKKVILYLVAHRDSTFFHPAELEIFKKADNSEFVKKDISVKEKELLVPCLDALLEKINKNPKFWMSNSKIALVTHAILSKGSGSKVVEAYNSICSYIIECVKADNLHPVEDRGIHMAMRKLFKHSEVEKDFDSFSECFIKMCDKEVINKLLKVNRGCFLLVLAIETSSNSVLPHLKEIFIGDKIRKHIENLEFPGAKILLKHLREKKIIDE